MRTILIKVTFIEGHLYKVEDLVKVTFNSPLRNRNGPISNTFKLLKVHFRALKYIPKCKLRSRAKQNLHFDEIPNILKLVFVVVFLNCMAQARNSDNQTPIRSKGCRAL